MASNDHLAASAAARERGNGFYKSGQFNEGLQGGCFSAPLSNLSAVRFEMGLYTDAVRFAEQALQLLQSEPDDSPKKQKLYARITKSLLYSLEFGQAELAKTAIAQLDDSYSAEGITTEALRTTIAEVQALWTSAPRKPDLREQVLNRLPRYKAHLLDTTEYYTVGHDIPRAIINETEVQALPTSQKDITFLFCGSGDARHILMTLFDFFKMPLVTRTVRFENIHFTILDLKPAALARTIIVFDILSRYSTIKYLKTEGHEDALKVASYVYTCQILPPFVFEKLQQHLESLTESLEEGEEDPFPEAKMTKDRKDFDALGAIFADDEFIKRREPRLGELYAAYKSGGPAQLKDLEQYLDENWKINITLLDSDQEAARNWNLEEISRYHESGCKPWSITYDGDYPANLCQFDPVETADLFVPVDEEAPSIEKMAMWFDLVTVGILTLHGKLTIEAVVGEMTDVMERIRYDALGHRFLAPRNKKDSDPRRFPKTFDRIHMSNIPDYIGGPLTVFLTARPLLREQEQANMRFNNLLNPPMFDSLETFQAEYLLMPHEKQITDHFAVVREREPKPRSFMEEDYFIWGAVPEKQLTSTKRMRRQEFETWIYRHLLKVCLPYPRPLSSPTPVHAPLNLTILFRLLERMSEVGYPAHWLSGNLASICTGQIETSARAPSGIVVHQNDLAQAMPKKKMSVAPWRAEFTTLLSIWRRLLPFGVITPKDVLVPLSDVVEYQVTFPIFREDQIRLPHFTLVFWNTQLGRPPVNIRSLILDDEEGTTSESAAKTRDQGVHVVTTFRFVTHTRTASFWLRRDVVDAMQAGSWKVYIWRTDNGMAVTEAVDVSKLEAKGAWLDTNNV
ncbi:hypothetical protein VPNG_06673 [Cytospora leucostoma]|uniref:DUF4470 domain-containing protein n=1 Tax=Cytospora leucostoma TaxID=1230097 RepID=A0A423WU27_9PEZI|nr:hypothetical protein VPNG_06673 [Cytospora leucostoma]